MPWNSAVGTGPIRSLQCLFIQMLCIGRSRRSIWRLSSGRGEGSACPWAASWGCCEAMSNLCPKSPCSQTGGICGRLFAQQTGWKCYRGSPWFFQIFLTACWTTGIGGIGTLSVTIWNQWISRTKLPTTTPWTGPTTSVIRPRQVTRNNRRRKHIRLLTSSFSLDSLRGSAVT